MRNLEFLIIIVLLHTINILSKSQEIDTIAIYKGYYKNASTIPQHQYISILILKADYTYEWINYTGEINDDKENYKDWQSSTTKGNWSKSKNIITLWQGDIEYQFIKRKKYIKSKKLRKNSKGISIQYKKWIFEKRIKYNLVTD